MYIIFNIYNVRLVDIIELQGNMMEINLTKFKGEIFSYEFVWNYIGFLVKLQIHVLNKVVVTKERYIQEYINVVCLIGNKPNSISFVAWLDCFNANLLYINNILSNKLNRGFFCLSTLSPIIA